ncbi:WbqC family protein [Chlorobium sp. N1]|uniref:WbqC family protein n=1 Tax=Chlorobium sp. N1 TaxID=2491138 RepID=UPI00103A141E|nr:WbqC family protein [Chlorobium sp. N1]TCD47279.1 hypothetical protein E0L29_08265 [Chlorobium sp. N1]
MKLAVNQPYFFPYIGYFQLIAVVDRFYLADNMQFIKRGWVHRNRILKNGEESLFSISLKKDSHTLPIRERRLSEAFERTRLLHRFHVAYSKAPHFRDVYPLLEHVVMNDNGNLFEYLRHSILAILGYLGIRTEIGVLSDVPVAEGLSKQDRLLDVCGKLGAGTYINAIGGMSLYSKEAFARRGIELQFLKPALDPYPQFGGAFIPGLSIVDVLMFNSVGRIQDELLTAYQLV